MPDRQEGLRATRVLPIASAVLLGVALGIGGFAFAYGDGLAYLSNDPAACANCHVMQGHFDTWLKSSHHTVAVCNDCHLPPGFAEKWFTKADNGLLHSLAFTTGSFPDPIRIKPRNTRRTQATCIDCHGGLVHSIRAGGAEPEDLSCVSCHAGVGHALR